MNPAMNPEFKRNLWLEITPTRLALMPILIGLALMTVASLKSDPLKPDDVALAIFKLSFYGFFACAVIWGCFLAGRALALEFSEGTWDSQRMSTLTPWQMAWGKLFGSTLYAWYGGIMLLVIAGISALQLDNSFAQIFTLICGLICIAIILHALTLAHGLQARRKKPDGASRLAGAFLPLLFLILCLPVLAAMGFFDYGLLGTKTILWWGHDWDQQNLVVMTLIFLTLWMLVYLWETMRRELMLPNRVWWWPLFLLFWIIWSAGFVPTDPEVPSKIYWTGFFAIWTIIVVFSGYVLLFDARKDQGMWLRLIAARKNPNKRLLQHLEPGWLFSFFIAIGLGIIDVCLFPETFFNLITLLCVCAFVARDVAWILWLNLSKNIRRAEGAALVSLAVAYGLLPLLFRSGNHFSFFLPPFPGTSNLEALLVLFAALLQAIASVALFYNRWRSVFLPPEKPNPPPAFG